jgi:hypothetical protein
MKVSLTRVGLWAIPAAGVLTLVPWIGIFFVGGGGSSSDQQLAQDQTPSAIVGFLYIAGLLCLLFGVISLYSVLSAGPARNWAALGMILGVIVIALLVGLWMILAFVDPVLSDVYRSGHKDGAKEAFDLMSGGHWSGRMTPVFVFGGLSALVASICLGYAIWRSGRFAKWIGPAFGVAFLLSALSAPFVTLVGAALLIVTGIFIARTVEQPGPVERPLAAAT